MEPAAETIWGGQYEHVAVVAHARVDNAEELRLATGGHPHQSLASTIASAYLRWGDGFPSRVVGDFAIVLWVALQRRLTACRDSFGVYPLVYRRDPRTFWIAS